jgi:vesicle-fusing ATPase
MDMTTLDFQVNTLPERITPNLAIADASAAYWFGQVALRLRREIAWCWHQRVQQPDPGDGRLPPLTDAATDNLSLVRYENQKRLFFKTDLTANYLSEEIAALKPNRNNQGCWEWLVKALELDKAAEFVLALGLAARLDASLAPVFSTCMNDLSSPFPTLALAQRLWDDPLAITACADPNHPLYRYGLLASIKDNTGSIVWQRPLDMPAIVARRFTESEACLSPGIELLSTKEYRRLNRAGHMLAARLMANLESSMQIVPLLGPPKVAFKDWALTLGQCIGRQVVAVDHRLVSEPRDLLAVACVCWMGGFDILLPEQWAQAVRLQEKCEILTAAQSIPLLWYVPVHEQTQLSAFPDQLTTPLLKIEGLDFFQRVKKLREELGGQAIQLEAAIEECARRFRFQEQTIERIGQIFCDDRMPLTEDSLATACANEATIELNNLAQPVTPRFGPDELILPADQKQQFQEVLHAMQTLRVVHYHWGMAQAWNESGIAVMFCGPPGTGKTMAAEALATSLALPIFRVDLSQVVNKYIGETEKNLKRIFDAAELSDCILFFDEADALFGKRTEVKDAHDRFANIEISYLLERMERFKGLAILATNRRKDLDDAFVRRLRFIIEFPMPGVEERRLIWRLVFPKEVDVSDVDFNYLAKQFHLSGGNIRSIAFNACLRSANADQPPSRGKVLMPDLLVAVKRELEKLNRTAGDEIFGHYSDMIKEQVGG